MKKNPVFFAVIIGVLIAMYCYSFLNNKDDNFDTKINVIKGKYKTLYVKRISWGITRDHSVVVISENNKNNYNDSTSIIFQTDNPLLLFYNEKTNILRIKSLINPQKNINFNGIIINIEIIDVIDFYKSKQKSIDNGYSQI